MLIGRFGSEKQRGAALVEMAIALPLLVLLVFGIVEYGLLFKEKLTIASATTSAARTGATMGKLDEADIAILRALEVGLFDQVGVGVIINVEIFRAFPSTGVKDTSKVNTYVFDPTDPSCMWNPCPDPAVYDPVNYGGGAWPPDTRDTTLDPSGGGLDVLGIEVTYHHTTITGLIPGADRDFTERSLVRLEPDLFGSSGGG